MTIAFISHEACTLHAMGLGHPERPERLGAIQDRLIASGMEHAVQVFDAPAVTREQLLRVHTADHIDFLANHVPADGLVWIDGDTAINPHTLEAASRAAGAAVLGVDLVLGRQVESAFASVRPPGHHAERRRAMGFCFFNNVAIGAAHAIHAWGLERVAIVDFDVHHGNGTEDIFWDEPRVLFCSSFQHPLFPYSGTEPRGEGIVNIPLPAYTTGAQYMANVLAQWGSAIDAFKPQLILISAGFDAHGEDELAQLRLTDDDYRTITAEVKRLADRHCNGHVVSVLEGGYALSALGRSAVTHLDALLGHY